MLDKLDATLRFEQEAMNLRAQRQQILAANIVNADTPGFQARDIDFASEMMKTMTQGRPGASGVALTLTSERHIPVEVRTLPLPGLKYRIPDQPSMDGNTVDMNRECTQFADTSLKYQSDLQFIGGQIKSMMSVLQSGG